MRRRDVLQVTGATFAAAIGAGCLAAGEEHDPIAFDESAELLLEPALLPEDGWERADSGEAEILDSRVTFHREVGDDAAGEADEADRWIVTSAAAGRDTEAEAVELYEELHADFGGRVGDARLMDLELASEAAIAGYDGLAGVIFRDANCVALVEFADCTGPAGCVSHVERAEELARTQQESWRDEPAVSDGGGESAAGQQDDGDDPGDEGDDGSGDEEADEADDRPEQDGDPAALELTDYRIGGGDPDEESITLRYTGEGTLEMSNWTIEDDGLVPEDLLSPFQFPSGFALDAGAEVAVVTGEGTDTDDTLYWGVGRQVWAEDGDVVYVVDANGEVVLQESIPTESPGDEGSEGEGSEEEGGSGGEEESEGAEDGGDDGPDESEDEGVADDDEPDEGDDADGDTANGDDADGDGPDGDGRDDPDDGGDPDEEGGPADGETDDESDEGSPDDGSEDDPPDDEPPENGESDGEPEGEEGNDGPPDDEDADEGADGEPDDGPVDDGSDDGPPEEDRGDDGNDDGEE